MQLTNLSIPDVQIITPDVIADERGFFLETWRQSWLPEVSFLQENHSKSVQHTLRGLHYQNPNPQGKLVRVTRGEVFDVAVDLRRDKDTFGQWVGVILSADNHKIFWVPEGFAHGFLVLSETAEFQYKCTDYYSAKDEHTLAWDDATLAIDWPLQGAPILSSKDQQGSSLNDAVAYGDV